MVNYQIYAEGFFVVMLKTSLAGLYSAVTELMCVDDKIEVLCSHT